MRVSELFNYGYDIQHAFFLKNADKLFNLFIVLFGRKVKNYCFSFTLIKAIFLSQNFLWRRFFILRNFLRNNSGSVGEFAFFLHFFLALRDFTAKIFQLLLRRRKF